VYRETSGGSARARSVATLLKPHGQLAHRRPLAAGGVPATAVILLLTGRFELTGHAGSRVIFRIRGITLVITALSLLFRRRCLAPMRGRLDAPGVRVTISSVGADAIGVTVLLLLYPRLPMAIVVGSDIGQALPLTLNAGMGRWWLGSVDWPLLTPLLTGSIPGIGLGSYLAVLVPDTILRLILAATLVVVGGDLCSDAHQSSWSGVGVLLQRYWLGVA
jgi:uncharacterized membrane protein YfcA